MEAARLHGAQWADLSWIPRSPLSSKAHFGGRRCQALVPGGLSPPPHLGRRGSESRPPLAQALASLGPHRRHAPEPRSGRLSSLQGPEPSFCPQPPHPNSTPTWPRPRPRAPAAHFSSGEPGDSGLWPRPQLQRGIQASSCVGPGSPIFHSTCQRELGLLPLTKIKETSISDFY